MKYIFKTCTAALAAALIVCTVILSACTVSLGADGRDGQDVSIYEIYEATNAARVEAGEEELTFLEFIEEYLSYDSEELAEATSLQTAINRSLLSSVQVTASFTETTSNTGGNPIFQQGSTTETYISQGSGVIIDVDKDAGDMYIVTNCHVIYSYGADTEFSDDVNVYIYGKEYTIYTYNNSSYIDDSNAISAEVIGASLTYDIAVLKVEGSEIVKNSNVVAAEWSTDENVYVGETVYAIGNAAGEGISATTGIVSVDSEDITLDMYDTSSTSDDFTYRTIRTSVPIYSGNSGGGLFNANGKLVGIINSKTVAASTGEYSDNISHALPAANVRRAVQNLIDRYEESGSFESGIYRATLGVTVQSVSSSAYMNNTTNLVEIVETIQVYEVADGALAEGSLQAGDQIVSIKITDSESTVKEEYDVTRLFNVSEILLSARVGDLVYITVKRSGEEITFTMQVTSACMTHYE